MGGDGWRVCGSVDIHRQLFGNILEVISAQFVVSNGGLHSVAGSKGQTVLSGGGGDGLQVGRDSRAEDRHAFVVYHCGVLGQFVRPVL